jgi:hypothetical protein
MITANSSTHSHTHTHTHTHTHARAQSGYSSSFGLLRSVSEYEYHARVADHSVAWAIYLGLALVGVVGVPAASYQSLMGRLKLKSE